MYLQGRSDSLNVSTRYVDFILCYSIKNIFILTSCIFLAHEPISRNRNTEFLDQSSLTFSP